MIARLLLQGGHRGKAIHVTGPRLLDWSTIAATLGLRFVDAEPCWFAEELLQRGTAPHLVEGMTGLFADLRVGRMAVVPDAITDLGGVLPRELDESGAGRGGAGGRRLVRSFVPALDAHDARGAADLVVPGYVQHNAAVEPGREGLLAATKHFLAAAPDLIADVVSTVSIDSHMAATIRWTSSGSSWTSHDLWRHDG